MCLATDSLLNPPSKQINRLGVALILCESGKGVPTAPHVYKGGGLGGRAREGENPGTGI